MTDPEECGDCGGSGEIDCEADGCDGIGFCSECGNPCEECDGSGLLTCEECDGTGEVEE